MKLTTRRDRIIEGHKEIERLIEKQAERVRKLQKLCDHKNSVMMAPFKSGILLDQHELRLCRICGIQESGWNPKHMHPGYGKDKTEVETTRDNIYELRAVIRGRTGVNVIEED